MSLITGQVSMAVGSAIWGSLASWTDTRIALGISAGAMLLLLAINRRVRVAMGDEANVTPGVPMPDLAIAFEPRPDDGPVLIQLEYRIDPPRRDEFLHAIRSIEPTRRRNGAVAWRIYLDLAEEGSFVERFVIQSWAEYVRLRTRMTMADRKLQSRMERLQRPGVPVRVSRLIGVDLMESEP